VAPFKALALTPFLAGHLLGVMPEGLILDVEQAETLVVLEVIRVAMFDDQYRLLIQFGEDGFKRVVKVKVGVEMSDQLNLWCMLYYIEWEQGA